jgi:DNA-binding NarL/FixJ family response regulator
VTLPTTALLEREAELESIERLLDAVRAGRGGMLTIEGEAGAGKTSLLCSGAELAEARGMRVLRARGGEFERDFAYGVVRQLFEPALADPAERSRLLSGDAISAAPIFEPDAGEEAAADPYGVQRGLHQLTVALAESLPVVLAVDDTQWADAASLRALAYIARRLDRVPAAVALTVRTGEPDAPERLLDELRGEPGCSVIVPSPLSATAAAALVSDEVGCRPSEAFARACCRATAGNPFLLVQLMRALEVEDADLDEADASRLAEIAAAGASRSILVRLARLGAHATDVARAAAVLEPNAEARLIAALAGLSLPAVADACERLVVAGLLSDSHPVAFVHPLVRAAVLSEMPAPRRAADHAHAARLLADDGAAGDAVASHLLLAEPSDDRWAVQMLRSAAAEALGRGAPDSAVSYLRRALCEPPAKEDRLDVSRELGNALLRADNPEGIEVLRAVRGMLDDPVARAEVTAELSPSLGLRRPTEEGARLLQESLGEIPDRHGRLGLLLRSRLLLQVAYGLEGVPAGALPEEDEDLDPKQHESRLAIVQSAFLYALGLGSMERARQLAERALSEPSALETDAFRGFPPALALGALILADREVSPEFFERLIEASKRRPSQPGMSASLAVRAYCRFFAGELERAQADADEALRLVRPLGFQTQMTSYLAVAVRTRVARGKPAEGERLLDEVSRGIDPGPGLSGAYLLVTRGELRNATAKHAEARHDFLAAAERIRWLPYANPEVLGWRTGLALAEAALGNDEAAAGLAAEAVSLAHDAGGARGLGVALRVQGIVAGGEGIELLREAVERLARTRARLQYAYALADLGAVLRRANRRREAREPLREALDMARRFGAESLEESVRAELAATGARPRKALLTGVDSLTPSELRVARLAAAGKTNREIAQSLVVSAKTIETHLRHVYQKLNIARRTELSDRLSAH